MHKSLEQIPLKTPEVSIYDVIEHIGEGERAIEGRRCVDGRYESDSGDSGRLARAGGDFGYVMALLAVNRIKGLGLTPEECFNAVYEAVTKDGGQFFMHTDEHVEHTGDGHAIGCGHIAKALHTTSGADYLVTCDDVEKALAHTRNKMKLPDNNVRMVSLSGEHEEQGVLIVTGTKKTVNPRKDNSMFFVYDQARDVEFLAQLVNNMEIEGLDLKDMANASEQQTLATLRLLAPGKPVFEVNVDGDKPVVNAGGHIRRGAA